MNPIVEKFNKTNPNYNLVVSEYEPEVIIGFVISKVNYALYNVLINTLEAKITYYGSRLLFKFHY